jgi:hypothetical protein
MEPLRVACGPVAVQAGNAHRDFHRLFVVEARIHGGLVCPRQVVVGQAAGAAGAFGDILAGEFEVGLSMIRRLALAAASLPLAVLIALG